MYKLSKDEVIQHKEALCIILDELYALKKISEPANAFYREYVSMITDESDMVVNLDNKTNTHSITEKFDVKPIHLFKARKCNGGWIYGTPMYECSAGRYKLIGIIRNSQKFAIEPSTLCESFQKYDIYKNLVYTNDIVLVHDKRFKLGDASPIYEVYYDAGNSEYCIRNKFESMSIANVENFEVISNVFNKTHLDSNGVEHNVRRWLYE